MFMISLIWYTVRIYDDEKAASVDEEKCFHKIYKFKCECNLVPKCLASEKISGKIDDVFQPDWEMKMARCKSFQPFLPDFSNLLFAHA